jgi:two-component system response regulator FlrC
MGPVLLVEADAAAMAMAATLRGEDFEVTLAAGGAEEPVAFDPATRAVLALARKVARSTATVLISGESGVGKEVVARYVHRCSPRADAPFVAINCAAIPEQLLEATLFGRERGAFGGALRAEAGKFEQARGGTLLLDEISEMPLPLQARLLRVLQEREVERVGGRRPVTLDVRVIATTHRQLDDEVEQGRFREDLYYRLNVFSLHLPPLRRRRADIVPLAEALLARIAREGGGRHVELHPRAKACLEAQDWPGNVRELANAVQRALIVAPGPLIDETHLRALSCGEAAPVRPAPPSREPRPAHSANIKAAERDLILHTLAAVNGSRKLAVQRLGISERTLRYKLQRYRLAGAL